MARVKTSSTDRRRSAGEADPLEHDRRWLAKRKVRRSIGMLRTLMTRASETRVAMTLSDRSSVSALR